MSGYDFELSHRPGSSIPHADALSRLPQVEQVSLANVSSGDSRIKIELDERKLILETYHDSADSGGHDGFFRTFRKISDRFWCPGMRRQVKEYGRTCRECQEVKARFRPRGDRMILADQGQGPMSTVHVDFADLEKKKQNKVVLGSRGQTYKVCSGKVKQGKRESYYWSVRTRYLQER